ncbi:MAG TPA: T9SS type A sorting domain-containing protein, partial [Chitinophagaceae bacterium]|nr:T9SS type A sorting domain-containing protein [Chitinophagaceae bacterium]
SEKSENETKAFPNPARPGQTITIEQHVATTEKISLQIFNTAGTAMGVWNMPANKGVNQFRFTTGQHWASGAYFFRILYANGRVAASGQIIIQ